MKTLLQEDAVKYYRFFHSIFPPKLFTLKLAQDLNTIEYDTRICVSCPKTLFRLTHEMAHIIETPNSRLHLENFGLEFPEYSLVQSVILPVKTYKTEVPFKRELRVFGIQYALLVYAKEEFSWIETSSSWSIFTKNVKTILIGATEWKPQTSKYNRKDSVYMCPSLKEKSDAYLYSFVDKKIYEYSAKYHYTKLSNILKRKFDYIERNLVNGNSVL